MVLTGIVACISSLQFDSELHYCFAVSSHPFDLSPIPSIIGRPGTRAAAVNYRPRLFLELRISEVVVV